MGWGDRDEIVSIFFSTLPGWGWVDVWWVGEKMIDEKMIDEKMGDDKMGWCGFRVTHTFFPPLI